MPRAGRFAALNWAKQLIEEGFEIFTFSSLPEHLRDKGLHQKASHEGFVLKTGVSLSYTTGNVVKNTTRAAKQFRVNKEVLTLNNSNGKLRSV